MIAALRFPHTSVHMLRSLRRAVVAALALTAAGALPAAAQTITVAYDPGSGPGTGFGQARFTITAGSSALFVNTLTFTAQPGGATFTPGSGGVALFTAQDALGPFGGFATVAPGGGSLFVDFVTQIGGPFTLDANGTGFVTLDVNADAGPLAFTFAGTTSAGAISGTVGSMSAVPEPATVVLLATGLGAVGLVARRRRA